MFADAWAQLGAYLAAVSAHSDFLLYAGKAGVSVLLLVPMIYLGRKARRYTRDFLRTMRCVDERLIPGLGTLAQYTVYFVGIGILLNLWGVNPTAVFAVLGTIGLTIGLALRNTLSNIASGVLLLLLRPFSPGDLIESGAILGKVREINLFTTLLDTPDGVVVEVTNGVLWGPPIRNHSRRAHRRVEIPVTIPGDAEIEELQAHVRNALAGDGRLCSGSLPTLVRGGDAGTEGAGVVSVWVLPAVGVDEEAALREKVQTCLPHLTPDDS